MWKHKTVHVHCACVDLAMSYHARLSLSLSAKSLLDNNVITGNCVVLVISSARRYCNSTCLLVCMCVRLFIRSLMCLFVNVCWGQISRQQMEIEAWFQWTTNRKWHVANQLVTWWKTSCDPLWWRCKLLAEVAVSAVSSYVCYLSLVITRYQMLYHRIHIAAVQHFSLILPLL